MNEMSQADTTGQQVDEDEWLLRLVWDPDDIDPITKELIPSAFAKADLKGPYRGLSVDQKSIAEEACILGVAQRQQDNVANHPEIKRTTPMISETATQTVTSLSFDDGERMFAVISAPVRLEGGRPENLAHAEILNISKRASNGSLNQMRAKLQLIFSKPELLEHFFPKNSEQNANKLSDPSLVTLDALASPPDPSGP